MNQDEAQALCSRIYEHLMEERKPVAAEDNDFMIDVVGWETDMNNSHAATQVASALYYLSMAAKIPETRAILKALLSDLLSEDKP